MATTHSWSTNRVKNNYTTTSAAIIDDVAQTTETADEILSAEATKSLIDTSSVALQEQIATLQATVDEQAIIIANLVDVWRTFTGGS